MDIKTYLPDEDPLDFVEHEAPLRKMFITATALRVQEELPTAFLAGLTPAELERQKMIEANGGVIYPGELDEELMAEIYVKLIRHPDMTIDDADQVIIEAPYAELKLIYPFSVVVVAKITASGAGITRRDILNGIHDAYIDIYKREASFGRVSNIDDRGNLLNREQTKGPFGIWGHDIEDLIVTWVDVFLKDGRYVLVPHLES